MMSKKYLPSVIYAFVSALLFVFYFTCERRFLDISYADIYYALASEQIWLILAVAFLFFSGISMILARNDKTLKRVLFWIHLLGSILGFVFLYFSLQSAPLPLRPINTSFYKDFLPYRTPADKFPLGYLVIRFVIGIQLVFVAAVLLVVIKPKKREEF